MNGMDPYKPFPTPEQRTEARAVEEAITDFVCRCFPGMTREMAVLLARDFMYIQAGEMSKEALCIPHELETAILEVRRRFSGVRRVGETDKIEWLPDEALLVSIMKAFKSGLDRIDLISTHIDDLKDLLGSLDDETKALLKTEIRSLVLSKWHEILNETYDLEQVAGNLSALIGVFGLNISPDSEPFIDFTDKEFINILVDTLVGCIAAGSLEAAVTLSEQVELCRVTGYAGESFAGHLERLPGFSEALKKGYSEISGFEEIKKIYETLATQHHIDLTA